MKMSKYLMLLVILLVSSCVDSTETINEMATELKDHEIFQVSGFRGKDVQISSKDMKAYDLLMKIDSINVEKVRVRIEAESTTMLDMYKERVEYSKNYVEEYKGKVFQSSIDNHLNQIKENQQLIQQEQAKLDSLNSIVSSYEVEVKKLKDQFNSLDYSVKFE